jgi:two-component system cell cycle response regulator
MPDTHGGLALLVGERIRQKIASEAFHAEGTPGMHVTVSVGVASLASPSDTAEALMKRADDALYEAKRQGRNRVAAAA